MAVLAISFSGYFLYARLTPAAADAVINRSIFVLCSLVYCLLAYPMFKGGERKKVPWYDLVLVALAFISMGYIFWNYEYIVTRYPTAHPLSIPDMVVAAIATLLVIEAARRTIGWALPLTTVAFILYGFGGPYLPGFLRHRGLSLEIFLDQTYFTVEGILGIPTYVAASYVILFVLFGAFLEKSGGGIAYMNFANALTGASKGGPGKVAVVSSSLFGTISGSAVANVMVDGWLTIPMMKKTGFKAPAAAAIEADASTGGQIMPPIMGAAAFVMAEFLGVSYITIMISAAIPAILYYVALFVSIHLEAIKTGLKGLPKAELPDLRKVLWNEGHLFIPILVILGLLLQGYSAGYAAIISTASLFVISWLRKASRMGLSRTLSALEDGARNTLPIAIACACAGIIIGIVLQTGLAIRFTSFLMAISGGVLFIALLIAMVASIILGMGIPTTASYIIMAAIVIPALIKMGVVDIAAHMFSFYFACLSAITPPVALAVYAAASIGRTGLWSAGLQAVKFAAAGFIVPFMFVYYPALLFIGEPLEIARAFVTAVVGVTALAAGLQGYLVRPANWLERILFLGAAFTLIHPKLTTDLIGLALLAAAVLMQVLWLRAPAVVRVPSPVADIERLVTPELGASPGGTGSAKPSWRGPAMSDKLYLALLTLFTALLLTLTIYYGVLRLY